MKYAIQELKNWSLNYGTCTTLKDYSLQCRLASGALVNKTRIDVSDEIIKDLLDSLERVLDGLKNWGNEHLESKKRQIKKSEDLQNAILFFRPSYKTHSY